MNFSFSDLKFKHPFTCIVSGMTSSGKTLLVRNILKNWKSLINLDKNNLKVLWCYGQMQELYNKPIENVETIYFQGKPLQNSIEKFKPDIIVLDDLMENLKNDVDTSNFFTGGSHHNNISVFFIVQNLFVRGNQMRTINLNSHYIILLRGLRSTQQVSHLAQQVFPHKSKQLLKIFRHATAKPYSYLLFDLHPQSNDATRLRTRILKEEVPLNLSGKHSSAPIIYDINLNET